MGLLSDRQIHGLCNRTGVALVQQDDWSQVVAFLKNELPVTTSEEEKMGYLRRSMVDPNLCMIVPYVESPIRYVHLETGEPLPVPYGEEPPADVPHRKVISYGRSSFGYDVRLKDDPENIKVFTNVYATEIDPKRICDRNFARPEVRVDEEGARYVSIPPNSYLQGPTVEWFRVPRDILIVALGKSTYARSGLIVNVTPIEPEFEGEVVIEIANTTTSAVRVYLGEGVSQFLFLRGDTQCEISYKDKLGKYMMQRGLQYAKV